VKDETIAAFSAKLTTYLDAAEKLLVEHAPAAADTVLRVIQYGAIFQLVIGIVCLISIPVFVALLRKCMIMAHEADHSGSAELLYGGGMVVCCVALITVTIAVMVNLLNFYNWLAAINPLLGLIYKVIH
jgi:hypothetical protein